MNNGLCFLCRYYLRRKWTVIAEECRQYRKLHDGFCILNIGKHWLSYWGWAYCLFRSHAKLDLVKSWYEGYSSLWGPLRMVWFVNDVKRWVAGLYLVTLSMWVMFTCSWPSFIAIVPRGNGWWGMLPRGWFGSNAPQGLDFGRMFCAGLVGFINWASRRPKEIDNRRNNKLLGFSSPLAPSGRLERTPSDECYLQ